MRPVHLVGAAMLTAGLSACHDASAPAPTAVAPSTGIATPAVIVQDATLISAVPLGDIDPVRINNRGQVVGNSNGDAVVWHNGTVLQVAPNAIAADINHAGRVAGTSYANTDASCPGTNYLCPGTQAFYWDGTLHLLGVLPGADFSRAVAITAQGHVVGYSGSGSGSSWNYRAFRWDGQSMHDLGSLGGARSIAWAADAQGRVVGESETASGERRPVLWQDDAVIDLGTLGGGAGVAYEINPRGQIVGWSSLEPGFSNPHAFVWERGVMRDLGPLDDESVPADINARGEIVGFIGLRGLPVLWDSEGIHELGTLGGADGEARAINERGDIAGYAAVTGHTCTFNGCHAFFWSRGTMYDLGIVGADGGIEYPTDPFERRTSYAYQLNEAGHVLGWSDGAGAVVWTVKR